MLTADCERPSWIAARAKLLRSSPATIVRKASISKIVIFNYIEVRLQNYLIFKSQESR